MIFKNVRIKANNPTYIILIAWMFTLRLYIMDFSPAGCGSVISRAGQAFRQISRTERQV